MQLPLTHMYWLFHFPKVKRYNNFILPIIALTYQEFSMSLLNYDYRYKEDLAHCPYVPSLELFHEFHSFLSFLGFTTSISSSTHHITSLTTILYNLFDKNVLEPFFSHKLYNIVWTMLYDELMERSMLWDRERKRKEWEVWENSKLGILEQWYKSSLLRVAIR